MKRILLKITSVILVFAIVCSFFPVSVHAAATKYETIKDDVPVWSEASSKSTKVYRIAHAGTIVEVASSTTNSSGNLWYKLTDGNWIFSGNVKKHSHKGIMCGEAEYSYEQYDAKNHIITITMPDLCACGYVTGYEITEKLESHSFNSNDKCADCGYQKPHEHKAVMCGQAEYSYKQYTAKEHITTIKTPDLCSCGHVMGYVTTEKAEAHSFNSDNKCTKCGYQKPHEHKAVMCGQAEYSYEHYTEKEHITIITMPDLCSCGHVMGYVTTEKAEAHSFNSDNKCTKCGYQKAHKHTAVMCGQAEYSYKQYDTNDHITTITMPDLCSCGYVMGYEITEKLESHAFDANDKCTDCGYQKAHEHVAVMCGEAEYSYKQYNAQEHITITNMPDLCSCGQVMGQITTEKIEAHSFNSNNRCTECGYEESHEHKAVMCGEPTYGYEAKDVTYHTVTITMPDLCSCGQTMGYQTSTDSEPHSPDTNGVCTKCGYSNDIPDHIHHIVGYDEYSYSYAVKNNDYHYITKNILNLCDCGSVISIDTVTLEETHNYKNDICKDCSHEKGYDILDIEASQIIEEALLGNYSDDVTLAGVVGEILIGEIPYVGTVADVRDVIYDIQNGEDIVTITLDAAALIPVVGGIVKYVDEVADVSKSAYKVIKHLDDISAFRKLAKASEFGIDSYNALRKQVIKMYGKGSGLEVHHIVEQRFAEKLGWEAKDMLCVVLTKEEHKIFTKAWRQIEYGINYNTLEPEDIWKVAQDVYKDYPELLEAARKTIFK